MPPSAMSTGAFPLCVDLDGTLIKSDSLWESALLLAKRSPLTLLRVPGWLMHGKAAVKDGMGGAIVPDAAHLPYHGEFLAHLRQQHAQGRRLILVTAADQRIADAVAQHVGIFSEAIGSSLSRNLAGEEKAQLLVTRFGEKNFDYAGNEQRDLKVWAHARRAITVNAPPAVVAAARNVTTVETSFDDRKSVIKQLARAIRPHQWVKNFLIFVPLAAAHRMAVLPLVGQAALAFVAMCCTTSGVYLLNDLLDLPADRVHHRKRHRGFAAGDLSLPLGLALTPVFLCTGLAISLLLPWHFIWVMLAYLVITSAYSYAFKQVPLLDVIILASLYTLRTIAGNEATGVAYSYWFLLLSMFFFFSLALLKRYSELEFLSRDQVARAAGRGYVTGDREVIGVLGVASGFVAVLVFALYLNSPEVKSLYAFPNRLSLICPLLLYWVSRLWLLAHRGRVHDDPVIFALKDATSYAIAILAAAVMFMAT